MEVDKEFDIDHLSEFRWSNDRSCFEFFVHWGEDGTSSWEPEVNLRNVDCKYFEKFTNYKTFCLSCCKTFRSDIKNGKFHDKTAKCLKSSVVDIGEKSEKLTEARQWKEMQNNSDKVTDFNEKVDTPLESETRKLQVNDFEDYNDDSAIIIEEPNPQTKVDKPSLNESKDNIEETKNQTCKCVGVNDSKDHFCVDNHMNAHDTDLYSLEKVFLKPIA